MRTCPYYSLLYCFLLPAFYFLLSSLFPSFLPHSSLLTSLVKPSSASHSSLILSSSFPCIALHHSSFLPSIASFPFWSSQLISCYLPFSLTFILHSLPAFLPFLPGPFNTHPYFTLFLPICPSLPLFPVLFFLSRQSCSIVMSR